MWNHLTPKSVSKDRTVQAEISSLNMSYVTDDKYGHVKSAEAYVKTSLFEVDLDFRGLSPEQLVVKAPVQWQARTITGSGEDLIDFDLKMSANTKPSITFCVPLMIDHNNGNETAMCLLLEPIQGKRGFYQRFGRFDLVKDMKRVFEEAKQFPLDEERCIESHGQGLYKIVLV